MGPNGLQFRLNEQFYQNKEKREREAKLLEEGQQFCNLFCDSEGSDEDLSVEELIARKQKSACFGEDE
jgi:hypothetical protein